MAQFGTVGYFKNKKYTAYTQHTNTNFYDTFTTLFWVYQYLSKFGTDNFKKQIDLHPAGFVYTKWNINSRELMGDGLNWGKETPAHEHGFSPYGNIYYSFDTKTLYGKTEYDEGTIKIPYKQVISLISLQPAYQKILDGIFKPDSFDRKIVNYFTEHKFSPMQRRILLYMLTVIA